MSKSIKIAVSIIASLSLLYAMLSGFGISGVESGTGGFIFRLIIIVVLLFSCSRVFSVEIFKQGSALLAGALGLGVLVIFELFSFAYIYLYSGEHTDITISIYTRNCAYLFFLTAVIILIPPVFKSYKTIRFATCIFASFSIAIIIYAIIINSSILLVYSTISIKILCFIAATVLYFKEKKNNPVRLFTISVRVICFLEMAEQLLILYGNIWNLRDIIISFYPVVYFLIGYALVCIRSDAVTNYDNLPEGEINE